MGTIRNSSTGAQSATIYPGPHARGTASFESGALSATAVNQQSAPYSVGFYSYLTALESIPPSWELFVAVKLTGKRDDGWELE